VLGDMATKRRCPQTPLETLYHGIQIFILPNIIQYSLMLNNKLVGDGDMPGIIVMEVAVTTV